MPGLRWVQLTGEERDTFLGRGGTGVLSFSTGTNDPPHSFPVSYGYAKAKSTFYFRLSFPPGSRREMLVDRSVTFVTARETDRGWRSVIATGILEDVETMPHEAAKVQAMWAIDIPTVDIFDKPRSEIPFHNFYLNPESLTGRKEVEE